LDEETRAQGGISCVAGEEAMAQRVSLIEYSPNSLRGEEMKELMRELWTKFAEVKSASKAA
jgi:hypothetical protein